MRVASHSFIFNHTLVFILMFPYWFSTWRNNDAWQNSDVANVSCIWFFVRVACMYKLIALTLKHLNRMTSANTQRHHFYEATVDSTGNGSCVMRRIPARLPTNECLRLWIKWNAIEMCALLKKSIKQLPFNMYAMWCVFLSAIWQHGIEVSIKRFRTKQMWGMLCWWISTLS